MIESNQNDNKLDSSRVFDEKMLDEEVVDALKKRNLTQTISSA